jgi:hypothetical protein
MPTADITSFGLAALVLLSFIHDESCRKARRRRSGHRPIVIIGLVPSRLFNEVAIPDGFYGSDANEPRRDSLADVICAPKKKTEKEMKRH